MKKIIAALVSLLIIVFLFLITSLITKEKNKQAKKQSIESIKNVNKEIVNHVKSNVPTLLTLFSPDCDYCEAEAVNINNKQKDIKDITIIFCTAANDSLTKVFAKKYGLDTLKNVHFVIDNQLAIKNTFSVQSIPANFIYNAHGQLIKQMTGSIEIDTLLKILQ